MGLPSKIHLLFSSVVGFTVKEKLHREKLYFAGITLYSSGTYPRLSM